MNDLWHSVKHSTLCTYADDTQISFADKDPTKVEEAINSDLMSIDRWYEENSMKRNPDKYQAMLLGKATVNEPNFKCNNTTLPLSSEIELLGVTVDNKLKFENHTRSICRKVTTGGSIAKNEKNLSYHSKPRKISTFRSYRQSSIIDQKCGIILKCWL